MFFEVIFVCFGHIFRTFVALARSSTMSSLHWDIYAIDQVG